MKLKVNFRECGRDPYSDVPHTHEGGLELIHVRAGQGKVFIGEHVIPFCGESVFLLDAAMLHCISPDPDVPYVRGKMEIDKALTCEMVTPLLEGGCLYRVPSPELSAKADRVLLSLEGLLAQGEHSLAIMAHVFELLHLCTSQMQEKKSEEGGTVADVVGYIHEHLETGITLSDVAEALHINKHYLCRLFKRETGMTVNTYINSARLAKAKQMLAESGESVTFIAAECGFGEPSLFTKNFKKEMGMTPSAYRNQTRSE